MDGNGRLGRLLVPLYLVDKRLLSSPNFYISAYLEAHRDEYYDRLLAVSREGDWTSWCAFFLTAIIEQARTNSAKARAILDLYQEKKLRITDLTHSQYAVRALDWLFSRPIFKTPDFYTAGHIPSPTARRILKVITDEGILRTLRAASGRRPAILAFSRLLNITEGREVF